MTDVPSSQCGDQLAASASERKFIQDFPQKSLRKCLKWREVVWDTVSHVHRYTHARMHS